MGYSSRHICQLFNISAETVRTWSEEFGEFLSSGAKPGVGRHRQFNDEDMRVLSLISIMKRDSSATFADIHTSLRAGQRGNLPALLPAEVETLVVSERESQLVSQLELLQSVIAGKEKEIEALLPVRDENVRLRALQEADEKLMKAKDARIAELIADLKAAQDEIRKLDREMGRLESRIDTTH